MEKPPAMTAEYFERTTARATRSLSAQYEIYGSKQVLLLDRNEEKKKYTSTKGKKILSLKNSFETHLRHRRIMARFALFVREKLSESVMLSET